MTSARKFMGGKFLSSEDVKALSDDTRKTTVDHVSVEAVSGKEKIVMYLDGIEEGLPLNTENIEQCIELFGTEEFEDWHGHAIEVYHDPSIRFQGKKVGGVRLRAVK